MTKYPQTPLEACPNVVACETRSCTTAGCFTKALLTGPTPHPTLGAPAARLIPLPSPLPIHAQCRRRQPIHHPFSTSIQINTMAPHPHVLIIGAGMTGLLLAQALQARNIAFSIYERDPNAHCRGPGWGLAIHWAKDTLLSLLPESLQARLLEANVDPEGAVRGECGRFPLFDLSSGERLFENLSDNRIRVSRERLRFLLMTDLHINVSELVQAMARKFC